MHTTEHELQFIRTLGTHRPWELRRHTPLTRKQLLSGYLAGLLRRRDFAGMDRDTLIAEVYHQLSNGHGRGR